MRRIILTLTLALFTLPILNAQDLPSYVPTEGLVAYYPFNGNANDESGNGYHGAVNGAKSTTDFKGETNSAYSFDGDDDYITTSTILSNVKENFTFSVWVKPQTTENLNWTEGSIGGSSSQYKQPVIHPTHGQSYGEESNSAGAGLYVGSNGLIVVEHSHDYVRNALIIETNLSSWNHITIVYKSNEPELYLNGSFVKSFDPGNRTVYASLGDDTTERANYSKSGFGSGFYPQLVQNFSGNIDEIIVWNRALSQNEIGRMYSSYSSDILLNGTVSAENNQIKNVADPTDNQDAATKSYVDSNVNAFSGSYNDLTDKPAGTYTQSEVDALISDLQTQIANLRGDPIDNEGNIYTFKTFGTQTWTTEHAAMETYRDGTEIPQVTDATEWRSLTTGAWCYYDNDSSKGKLYNWYAVMGIHDAASLTDASLRKAFAPDGWHVPTDDEWVALEEYLIANGYNYDGTTTGNKIAKAMASTTGWNTSTTTGAIGNDQSLNNSSGFNAFPEGSRNDSGSFSSEGSFAIFWSSTENYSDYASSRSLGYKDSLLSRYGRGKRVGFSVRFVRD